MSRYHTDCYTVYGRSKMGTKYFALVIIYSVTVLCNGLSLPYQKQTSEGLGMVNPKFTFVSNNSFTVAVIVGVDLLGGGALVEQDWVLTAASVLRDFNTSDLRVRVGSNSAYEGGTLHHVVTVVPHPNYVTNSSYNLALMRLDTPVYPRVASKIHIARIPFESNGVASNTTGYGATSSSKTDESPGLQIAHGSVYTASYCRHYWSRTVSSLHICAYSSYTVPCFGDDGDPVSVCWGDSLCKLLGINAGIDKCNTYNPYALMDVGQFAPWILDTLKQNFTESN